MWKAPPLESGITNKVWNWVWRGIFKSFLGKESIMLRGPFCLLHTNTHSQDGGWVGGRVTTLTGDNSWGASVYFGSPFICLSEGGVIIKGCLGIRDHRLGWTVPNLVSPTHVSGEMLNYKLNKPTEMPKPAWAVFAQSGPYFSKSLELNEVKGAWNVR